MDKTTTHSTMLDFPGGLPVKILKALLSSSILATYNVRLNLLDLINLIILVELNLLHSPFSSLLDPNIRLRILFFNTVG